MESLRRDNDTLRAKIAEQQERLTHMSAQLIAYKEDFESERADRERAQGQISDLINQRQQERFHTDSSVPTTRTCSSVQQHGGITSGVSWCGDIQIDGEYVHCIPKSQAAALHRSAPAGSCLFNHTSGVPAKEPARRSQGNEFIPQGAESRGHNTASYAQRTCSPELRGRGFYQKDFVDETDGLRALEARTSNIQQESEIPSSYTPTCGFATASNNCSPLHFVNASLNNVSTSAQLVTDSYDQCDSPRPCGGAARQREGNPIGESTSSELLQCPKCYKSFTIENHHLLVEHIEEVCMQ